MYQFVNRSSQNFRYNYQGLTTKKKRNSNKSFLKNLTINAKLEYFKEQIIKKVSDFMNNFNQHISIVSGMGAHNGKNNKK